MKTKIFLGTAIIVITAVTVFLYSFLNYAFIPLPPETSQTEYAIDGLNDSRNYTTDLDEGKLSELINHINASDYGKIHSLVIIHNDRLVLEKYFLGWSRHMLHPSWSATKSITSALIGIALDQNKISELNQKVLTFFPEYNDIANLDERKKSITIGDLLTMTAGYPWDEISGPYVKIFATFFKGEDVYSTKNDGSKLALSNDWIKYMLDYPMKTVSGDEFVYNSGCSILLSGILKRATGQSAEAFAVKNLFDTIGITDWQWETGPAGITNTGWGLRLHPVDMAMFGYLYLKNGQLNGKQIISKKWVQGSTAKKVLNIKMPRRRGLEDYGYHWWRFADADVRENLKTNDIFFAKGAGGQFIFVVPHLEMVVVITAENWRNMALEYGILFDYILPAVNSS
jgi:CubicO group peptidase (beta-lactamase class C family)